MTKANSSSTGWWLSKPTSENQVWVSLPFFAFVSHLQSEVDKNIPCRMAASEFHELVDAKGLTWHLGQKKCSVQCIIWRSVFIYLICSFFPWGFSLVELCLTYHDSHILAALVYFILGFLTLYYDIISLIKWSQCCSWSGSCSSASMVMTNWFCWSMYYHTIDWALILSSFLAFLFGSEPY